MKKIFLIAFASLFFGASLISQTADACDGYWLVKQGVTLEYEDYNAKGKLQGGQSMKITSMEDVAGVLNAKIHSIIKDDKGEVTSEGDYGFTCSNGEIKVDMRSMMSQEQMDAYKDMEVSIDQSNLVYPSSFTEGQTLPDGKMTMKVSSSGMVIMTMEIFITDRKVEKFESITTPAGTFECVKLTQTSQMNMGFMKTTTTSVDWFAKSIGSIRNESYDKKGELMSYRILTKISE